MSSIPFPYSGGQLQVSPDASFNLTDFYGNTVSLTAADIRQYREDLDLQSITYSLNIGLSSMLFFVMAFLAISDRARLRRPIFVLNLLGLFLSLTRGVLADLTLSMDSIAVSILRVPPSNINTFTAIKVFYALAQVLLYSSILGTLLLQVHVVFAASKRTQIIIVSILSVIAVVLFGLQLSYLIYDIITRDGTRSTPQWLNRSFSILFVTFIAVCSIIFLYKLFVAIRQRRRVGVKHFGPFELLFVSTFQCLVIPGTSRSTVLIPVLIYTLTSTGVIPMPNFVNFGQTILVCSLPLSTLWAATSEEGRKSGPSPAKLGGPSSWNGHQVHSDTASDCK